MAVKSEGACWVQEKITARLDEKARFGRKVGGEVAGVERKLRPDWAKQQVLAVKSEGACWVQEKITARLDEKASFGRKSGGKSLGSRDIYGQIGRKRKIWP